MKKIMKVFVLVAAAAMALASCQKPEVDNPNPQEYEYTFLLGSADTKAVIGENSVEWENGDQIGIYAVTTSGVSANKYGAVTPGAPAKMVVYSEHALTVGDMVYAYFPRIGTNADTPDAVKMSIPSAQDGKNDMPMVSLPLEMETEWEANDNETSASGLIKFCNVGSVIEFNVYSTEPEYRSEKIQSVSFIADKSIAGDFEMNMEAVDGTDATLAVELTNGSKEVVFTLSTPAEVPAEKSSAAKINMVVAPGTYTGTVVVKTDVATYTYEISTAKDFARSAVKPLGVNLATGEREAETKFTWDLTKESYESASADKVEWVSEFVNLTLEKGGSSTAANNHLADEHSRVYKDQIMTFDPLGKYKIQSIEFAVVSGYDDEFAKASWVNGEPVTSGNTVVVTPTDGHAKVSATLGAATRFTSITVYYSYDENYELPTVESIAVDGQTTESMQDSEFVFGGTVTARYTDGETADVTSAAQFSGYDMSTPGEQTVEVSYTEGEKTVKTTYQLTVLAADADVTDKLNLDFTGQSGTTYGTWLGKKASSDAVYAGNSAGDKSSIQLRSNNSNSGIVTTTSGGYAKKVVVTWQEETSDGRTLNIYGKNTAYTAATDLYDTAKQGTLLGTIKKGTSTEFVIPGNYQYIGLRSASGAMYISEIQITWSSSPIALESIAVSGQETEYYVGDSFVAPTVTATYSDGSSSVVSGAEFSGYDMSQEGEQTVTVSYTQGDVTKETTYTINVKAKPALASIVIDGTPKTEYTVGDTFDAPAVKATYSDNSSSLVSGAEFTGYDLETAGNQTVNVSYTENGITKSTSYDIVVKDAPTSGGVVAGTAYSYTFTAKQWSANGAKTLNGLSWTLAGNGGYWGYDGTKGHQFGSGNAPYKSMTLSTTAYSGGVKKIVINTSGASSINAKLTVTVGGVQIGSTVSLTSSAKEYTFEVPGGGMYEGEIKFSYTQTSSKALYIKSIKIN